MGELGTFQAALSLLLCARAFVLQWQLFAIQINLTVSCLQFSRKDQRLRPAVESALCPSKHRARHSFVLFVCLQNPSHGEQCPCFAAASFQYWMNGLQSCGASNVLPAAHLHTFFSVHKIHYQCSSGKLPHKCSS